MNLTYRPYETSDYDWLYALRETSYREVVERQFGVWDPLLQKQLYDESWRPELVEVVCLETEVVGMVSIEDQPARIFVREIQLLPNFQGKGIGSQILAALIKRARSSSKVVRLQILHENHRARKLYERLGFEVSSTDDTHLTMCIV